MKLKNFASIMLATTIAFSGNVCEAKSKSSIAKKLVVCGVPIVVLAGGVVGAAGLGGYFIYRHYNNKKNPDTKTNVPVDNTEETKEEQPVNTNSKTTKAPSPSQDTNQTDHIDDWIKILSGETVSGFRYSSGNNYRKDNDNNLENYHNYIQVFFPNVEPSGYANRDLNIKSTRAKWKAAFAADPTLLSKIQRELRLNLMRILNFWKFDVEGNKDHINKITLPKDRKSQTQLGVVNDHNSLRATRVLHALRLFELNEEHQMFLEELNKNFSSDSNLSTAVKFWNDTKNTNSIRSYIN